MTAADNASSEDMEALAYDARGDALILALAYENAFPNDGKNWGTTYKVPDGYSLYIFTEEQSQTLGHAVYRVLRSCRAVYAKATGDEDAS